ncbi:MAG: DUF3362 domain-containing protein, partial [Bacteroidales bacterium]|nr:DUF3362 domain-containing protein [Bacteroidales bacterium]
RYDLILNEGKNGEFHDVNMKYAEELICHHVSGRLKVAPEHTNPEVLKVMRKPSFELFYRFKALFDEVNRKHGLRQQIIPYFISSHPGSTEEAMAELAAETKKLDFQLEQVQDFTPTPMTVSTEIYYTGFHPYTLEPCFCARNPEEKKKQRAFFFWYQRENVPMLRAELQKMGRRDLIDKLFGGFAPNNRAPYPHEKSAPGYSHNEKPVPTRHNDRAGSFQREKPNPDARSSSPSGPKSASRRDNPSARPNRGTTGAPNHRRKS